jgi:hypothetical protein
MTMVVVVVAVALAETSLLDSFDALHEESQCLDYLRPGLQGRGLCQEHGPLGPVQLLQDHQNQVLGANVRVAAQAWATLLIWICWACQLVQHGDRRPSSRLLETDTV